MDIFVVTMYRMGQFDADSYNIGVYSSEEKAVKVGEEETYGRGWKYGYTVEKLVLDHYDPNEDSELPKMVF